MAADEDRGWSGRMQARCWRPRSKSDFLHKAGMPRQAQFEALNATPFLRWYSVYVVIRFQFTELGMSVSLSHHYQASIDLNTANTHCPEEMFFLIHVLRWISWWENVHTLPQDRIYWVLQPLRLCVVRDVKLNTFLLYWHCADTTLLRQSYNQHVI